VYDKASSVVTTEVVIEAAEVKSAAIRANRSPGIVIMSKKLSPEEEEEAIETFRQLVRFPTVSNTATDGSYDLCADYLLLKLKEIGFDAFIIPESKPNKPIVVGTWKGLSPELPGILLNSHYDVVPVITEMWTVPAFEAIRKDGKIYGRGTQDMKCVCTQYLIALKKLKSLNYQPNRTIYISYVPDEEIGGIDGMNVLTESEWFKGISVDLALDEGLANPGDQFTVFYGERLPWWVRVKAVGNTGHGSRFIEGTAVEQVVGVVNKALEYRQQQKDLLHGHGHHAGCSHAILKKKFLTLGDVTSINVTMLRAGVQAGGKDVINVVPPTAEAGFDIRISPHVEPQTIADTFTSWCHEVTTKTSGLNSSQGVSWEFFYEPLKQHHTTSLDASENPWWQLLASTLSNEIGGVNVIPEIFPAATDSRFLRALGLKVFGFSPIRHSPILLHEHDEYLEEVRFLEGVRIYIALVEVLSSVKQFS
jgi:aminoacylase